MASLVEGQTYGLSSSKTTSGSKFTAVYVKLTDSSIKAIEEYNSIKVRYISIHYKSRYSHTKLS